LFSDEQVGEEYIREAHIYRNGAKTKDKKKFYFFELTTYDISLCNKDEIDRILNKYHRLFSATDEINFSQVKID
jgi:arginine/lysine/ornithine decarboxylase